MIPMHEQSTNHISMKVGMHVTMYSTLFTSFGWGTIRKTMHAVSHHDTEELFGKVLLVFLLHNGQSSCLKHLVESLHTSKAERKHKREREQSQYRYYGYHRGERNSQCAWCVRDLSIKDTASTQSLVDYGIQEWRVPNYIPSMRYINMWWWAQDVTALGNQLLPRQKPRCLTTIK